MTQDDISHFKFFKVHILKTKFIPREVIGIALTVTNRNLVHDAKQQKGPAIQRFLQLHCIITMSVISRSASLQSILEASVR